MFLCIQAWICCSCQRKEFTGWLAGRASELGQQGAQELTLLLSAPLSFCLLHLSCLSLRPVVATSCLLHGYLPSWPHPPSVHGQSGFSSVSPSSPRLSWNKFPSVVASDDVICVSLVFSRSVKLWNHLIETDYKKILWVFSLLEVSPSYAQAWDFSQSWLKRMEQFMVCNCSGFSLLISAPRNISHL